MSSLFHSKSLQPYLALPISVVRTNLFSIGLSVLVLVLLPSFGHAGVVGGIFYNDKAAFNGLPLSVCPSVSKPLFTGPVCSFTLLASPASFPLSSSDEWWQFVAVDAMSLSGIDACEGLATVGVDPCSDSLKVIRIAAGSIAAQVIDFQAFGYGPFGLHIGHPVSGGRLAICSHVPISVLDPNCAGPYPATSLVDFDNGPYLLQRPPARCVAPPASFLHGGKHTQHGAVTLLT